MRLFIFTIYLAIFTITLGCKLFGQVPIDSLVAFYPLNGNAKDFSNNNNDGIIYGGVAWDSSRSLNPRGAARLDGTSGVIFSTNTIAISGNQARSMSFWINLDEFKDMSNLVGWGTVSDVGTLCYVKGKNGQLYFHGQYVMFNLTGGTLSLNKWQHVVFTYDGLNGALYLDTVKVASDTSTLRTIATRLSIGFDSLSAEGGFNRHLRGRIDDIRIYRRLLSVDDIIKLYNETDDLRQRITSIVDIPNDQGGKVRICWNRIYLDSTGMTPQVTSYGIWRKISPGMAVTKFIPNTMSIYNDTLGLFYDYLGTVNAIQSPQYNFVAQTLADSPYTETYLITAHTSDPNIYYISDARIGYSVDNLPPAAPTVLVASIEGGNSVKLSWDQNTQDHDFKNYEIHKSTIAGFTPDLGTKIGETTAIQFVDNFRCKIVL